MLNRHDWSDEDCVRVLAGVKLSMSPTSRLLIVDQVANTTFGCPEFSPAPSPLPANYGFWNRLWNAVDLDMMVLVNGVERTPAQFRVLAASAGLETYKIWECRGADQIVELRLPPAEDRRFRLLPGEVPSPDVQETVPT